MGEISPKTKSYPPLIKQKLISTPPHIMLILIGKQQFIDQNTLELINLSVLFQS